MRKLLVATHERFASGIMETFKLIMGENENISSKVLKKLGITPTAPNTSTAPKTTTPKTK